MNQQDAAFEKWTESQPAHEVKAIRAAVVDTLTNEYGISKDELMQLYNIVPALRSLAGQRLLYDATRLHLAKQAAATTRARPVPTVQRPGMAGDFGFVDHSGVAEAYRAFEADSSPRKAAALLTARRRAAAANRR
jgi:hypothetical protein